MSKPIIPTGIHDDALVGYLNVATICTTNMGMYYEFYGGAMKMKVDGPFEISEEEKSVQKSFWKIPEHIDYDLYHIYRESVPSLVHIRVIHLKTKTPHIHNSYQSYELGTFSLGFPTSDLNGMTKILEEYNVGSMAPMQEGIIIRDNGDEAKYLETIFKGPDYLHCVGIERVAQPQLAPCDPKTGICGPGYSAIVVKNADAEIDFYTKVLDHNLFLDAVWEASEGSALGIDTGEPFRFINIYAPNVKQNHILMLEFKKGKEIDTGTPSTVPNQGLGMYTFQTSNINKVIANAEDHNIKILSRLRTVEDCILGNGRSCLLQSPNGFYIEIFEKSNR